MNKQLNFSILAALIAVSLGCSIAYASLDNSIDKELSNVRIYVNTQPRSLYQIALLSDVSVAELRKLNKGLFDNRDTVNVDERIVLPINSKLLVEDKKVNHTPDKLSSLPTLGSDENAPVNPDENREMETHVANALQQIATQDWKNLSTDKIKQRVQTEAESRAESYVRDQVRAQVINPVQQAAQDLLGKFGTAQLNLAVSDKGSFKGSSLKLFSPWYDSERMLTFSQISVGDYDGRTIGNFGLGQRWDLANNTLMLGYNAFYDRDFSRGHTRLGFGVEAWADYLKLAANYYSPLSDWKDSKDFEDYLERAARGFDVRMQAYLPSYPHLGGSLTYEQYFGDEVALFGKDNLQKDPRAVSIGIDYTPVPLFTVKGQYKQGQGGKSASVVDLTMNYRMGVPLNEQLDPQRVNAARTLKGSRYDMVDRNNNIILEYKQQKPSLAIDLGMSSAPERGYFALKLNGVKIGDPKTYPENYFLYQDRTTSISKGGRGDGLAPMSLCREVDPNATYRYTPIILGPGIAKPNDCTNENTTPIVPLSLGNNINPATAKGFTPNRDDSKRQIGEWEILTPPFDIRNNDNYYQFVVEIRDKNGNPVKSNPIDLTVKTDRKGVLFSEPVKLSPKTVNLDPEQVTAGEKQGNQNADIKADGKDNYVLKVHLERPTFEGEYKKFNDELPEAMRYLNDLKLNQVSATRPKTQELKAGKPNPSVWWDVLELNTKTGEYQPLPEQALQLKDLDAGAPLPDLTCTVEGGCVRLTVWKNDTLGTGLTEDAGIVSYSTTITSTRPGAFKVGAAFPPPKGYPVHHDFEDPFYKSSQLLDLTFDASAPPPQPPEDPKMVAIMLEHKVNGQWEIVAIENGEVTDNTLFKVGDSYRVTAKNSAGEAIPPANLSNVSWSVYGTNEVCGATPVVTIEDKSAVVLQAADNGQIVIGESNSNPMELTIPANHSNLQTLGAACGVQGFKLRVSVNQN